MSTVVEFDKRAAAVKKTVLANEGKAPSKHAAVADGVLGLDIVRANLLTDMKSAVRQVDALRAGSKDRKAVDISWADFAKEKWGFGGLDSFYAAVGVNPSHATIESLMTMPEMPEGYRWLVPEVIREAVRLGLRKAPIYPNLIAAEETVSQPQVIMPSVNMSDAMPKKIGEAETIPVGNVSFNQKTVTLQKVGTGIKMTDEVMQYVSLNLLSIYLQDVGVKLGIGLDTLAVDVLINGDQAGGTEAAPVVGVNVVNTLAYIDILRTWIRMGRLGRMPAGILSNEEMALTVLSLPEFKALAGKATLQNIQVQTPVPATQNYWIHGAMPANDKIMLIDPTAAMVKLNSTALRVESERIVERQINGTFVTLTTGFAGLFRDARVIIDKSVAYGANPFPDYMDVGAFESEALKD